ncbi:MAG: JAB domain-containing protein [Acetatifactor sp.]
MGKQNPFQLDVVSVRLVRDAPIFSEQKITNPESAIAVVGELLCEIDREVVCVINLKSDGTPINCNFASVGAINQAVVEPRELFKSAILSNAATMIMVHNHPSGNVEPSKTDTVLTDRILKLSFLLGIPLADHVIVGGDNRSYFSFKEKGLLTMPQISLVQHYQELDFQENTKVAERGRRR